MAGKGANRQALIPLICLCALFTGCVNGTTIRDIPAWNSMDYRIKPADLPIVCAFVAPKFLNLDEPLERQVGWIGGLMTLDQFAAFLDAYIAAALLTRVPGCKVPLAEIVKRVAKTTPLRDNCLVWFLTAWRVRSATTKVLLPSESDAYGFICYLYELEGSSLKILSRKESIAIIKRRYPWLVQIFEKGVSLWSLHIRAVISQDEHEPLQIMRGGPSEGMNVVVRFGNQKFKYIFCPAPKDRDIWAILFPPFGVLCTFSKDIVMRVLNKADFSNDLIPFAVYAPRLAFMWDNPNPANYEVISSTPLHGHNKNN